MTDLAILDHPRVLIRFLSYIDVDPVTGCHVWKGGRTKGGDRQNRRDFYGTFNPGGGCAGVRAHVFAAWKAGLIPTLRVPEGMNLDHTCVNSLCVNARHLELVPKLVNQERKAGRPTQIEFDDAPRWTVVPTRPTPAMEDAFYECHASARTVFAEFDALWQAMLDAAPRAIVGAL